MGVFCPEGFCRGVYVWGVFVRGVFVLEPSGKQNSTAGLHLQVMDTSEKFRQNLLIKFHLTKEFIFLIHETEKNSSVGFVKEQNIESL